MILFRAGVDISLWQTAENNLKIELLKIYEIGFQRFYEISLRHNTDQHRPEALEV